MKPKNFPERKKSDRAVARREGVMVPTRAPHVADTRFRLGRAERAREHAYTYLAEVDVHGRLVTETPEGWSS